MTISFGPVINTLIVIALAEYIVQQMMYRYFDWKDYHDSLHDEPINDD